MPAALQEANHFVCAQALPAAMKLQGQTLVASLARAGWAVVTTVLNEDCGLDTLNLLEHAPRGHMQRQSLRRLLRDFMLQHAGSPDWHAAFVAAREDE